MRNFSIKGNTLNTSMRFQQYRSARSFITSSAFHTYKTIFHQVKPTNTVLSTVVLDFRTDVLRGNSYDDLDLIFYGDVQLDTPVLTLPHPRWQERAFVLRPLADICPERVTPAMLDAVRHQTLERWV